MLQLVKPIFEKNGFCGSRRAVSVARHDACQRTKAAMTSNWRSRAKVSFECDKRPAFGARMVVTSHPLGSAAGAEMLAEGGNAVDAAVASLLALTVVEPMMVGVIGGGLLHLRRPDDTHVVIDGMSTAPAAARSDMYEPTSDEPAANAFDVVGQRNSIGAASVAVPGNLVAWAHALQKFGRMPLASVIEPAIRYASRGFAVSAYLANAIGQVASDLVKDEVLGPLLVPGGAPLRAGARLVQRDCAETLRTIARDGTSTLHGGPVGRHLADHIGRLGGHLSLQDLADYRVIERGTVQGAYRGFQVVGPPPPCSAGVHIIQMLNILEHFDLHALGFGSPETLHLLAEVMKIAFADRAAATADPAFIHVPVERLTSRAYADLRRGRIDAHRAQTWSAGVHPAVSPNTTHVTVADDEGNVVAATHTINNLFGARFGIPGLGLIPNNYMNNFDPHPGRALSIAPGKRITTSQAPMMVLRDGKLVCALGLPGGLRIFGSAMQAIINLIDHGMSLQEAVEAPRVWTQGAELEVEAAVPLSVRNDLEQLGHRVSVVPHVAGGMNAIGFAGDGTLTGASCWRADGTPIGVGGGPARAGVSFWPNQSRR
jgi:gamma-glutamyltranspeptidase / glutathione hydrolase